MMPSVKLSKVSLQTGSGRMLFQGLSLQLSREHVALVGRNGVGKSTLLALLAGATSPTSGVVEVRGSVHHLPQAEEEADPLSGGERRRKSLEEARASGAEILLLDEPTLHLDEGASEWCRGWLASWPGAVLVASHDRQLLSQFRHFFVLSEAGSHYFGGSLAELEAHLEQEHDAHELRYARNLTRLAEQEAHVARVASRKARKRRRGRCSELDRATPRIRLNAKRGEAQVSHGRLAKLREAKLSALRGWTRATRRALDVQLALSLPLPELPVDTGRSLVSLQDVAATVGGRALFEGLDLQLGRERVAVVGPNGSGKTTLLQILLGQRRPERGSAHLESSRVGFIEQGGRNWIREESLRAHLLELGLSSEEAARALVAHRFPLALAGRPLRSLSPGERARAALIALFARAPAVELLVLDEPTFSLDLVAVHALTRALRQWQGGLVVASHDQPFLAELDLARVITLGATS